MRRFRSSPVLLAPLALLLALNLAACGNKGPLVRPGVDEIEDVEEAGMVDDVEEDAEATEVPDDVPEVGDETDDDATGEDSDATPIPADSDGG